MGTRPFTERTWASWVPWLGACAASACVADLGDLGELPDPPESVTPPLFSPLSPEAGAPNPAPTSSVVPTRPPPPVQPDPVDPEPNGNGAFTLLHGVIDAPWGAFCAVVSGANGVRFAASPIPRGGLGFGSAVVVPMEGVVDATSEDIQFFFVAAQPEHLDDGCEPLLSQFGYALPASALGTDLAFEFEGARDAGGASEPLFPLFGEPSDVGEPADAGAGLAIGFLRVGDAGSLDAGSWLGTGSLDAGSPDVGSPSVDASLSDASAPSSSSGDAGPPDAAFSPPSVRVAELPRLVAGTYLERSYLFATGGCIGAPGLDPLEIRCGPGFDGDRSSFSAVFVPLSRVTGFNAVGLQVVHANATLAELTVRSDPQGSEGAYFTLASGLVLGGVQPYTAQRSLSVSDLGEPLSQVSISVASWPGGYPVLDVPWPTALEPNGIALQDGRAFALVVIGGEPGSGGRYENPASITVVASDPLRE